MKTYPYNRTSVEGRKLYRLLGNEYNPGVLETPDLNKAPTGDASRRQFETFEKSVVMQCRANRVALIFESNLSGLKRPQIHINADVEMAWGEFADNVKTLDFTHGEELPITFVQPLEDDTIKALVDAGAYSDPRFEELISKLIEDEEFDVEGEMSFSYLDVGNAAVNQGEADSVPVIIVDPVNIVHDEEVKSQYTSVTTLVNRSAALVIELRKEDVKSEEIVELRTPEVDQEVYIDSDFTDVIAEREQALENAGDSRSIAAESELLDVEVDVTDKLAGSLGFDATSEEDTIRDLKERGRERAYSGIDIDYNIDEDASTSSVSIDDAPDEPSSVFDLNVAEGNIITQSEHDKGQREISADAFDGVSLDEFEFEDDEDELNR